MKNNFSFFLKKRGCPGWGANPGPLNFNYFLILTTLPLSHSGSPEKLSRSAFFDEKSIPFHEQFPCSS
jgi:hypothetical protein